MNLRAKFYKKALDSYFYFKKPGILKTYSFLEKSQWWSSSMIKEFQNEAVQSLIQYAYKNVPYYHKIMKEMKLKPLDIKTTDDLTKLPILDKETMRNRWKELISQTKNLSSIKVRTTGGTSGQPLQIVKDEGNEFWENACFRRGLGFSGYESGETSIKLFGGSMGISPATFSEKVKARFRGEVFLPAFEISNENIGLYIDRIKQSKANFLKGYSSAIYLLAKLAQKAGLKLFLRAVFPTAETLPDFYRETIKDTFQCEIFEYYGCGEIYSLGFECKEHSGLHISDEHVFLEVLKKGERVFNEEMGKATVTTLHNYTMPLIRYQNGDLVSVTEKPCKCNRGLSRISKVYGRANDFLLAKDGRLISGAFIPHLFRNIRGIGKFQVVQETEDMIFLNIVKCPNFSKEELKVILETLRRYLGEVEIIVKYSVSITVPPSGKIRSVISKVTGDRL